MHLNSNTTISYCKGILLVLGCATLGFAEAEVCFGPCRGAYEATTSSDFFRVECSRYYNSMIDNRGCLTDMKTTWDITLPAVNEFSGIDKAYEEGRGLEACEQICAMSNSCEAFGISSQAHINEGKWQCIVYYNCGTQQYNEHLNLYVRNDPKACFAKVTSHDGVFVNFLETNGIVSQTTRTLNVPIKRFMDLHLTVNGKYNTSLFGYKPYHEPRSVYCDNYDSDCILLHAGPYSVTVMAVFLLIITFNAWIIWILVERTTTTKTEPQFPRTRLRKRTKMTNQGPSARDGIRKRISGASGMQF